MAVNTLQCWRLRGDMHDDVCNLACNPLQTSTQVRLPKAVRRLAVAATTFRIVGIIFDSFESTWIEHDCSKKTSPIQVLVFYEILQPCCVGQ